MQISTKCQSIFKLFIFCGHDDHDDDVFAAVYAASFELLKLMFIQQIIQQIHFIYLRDVVAVADIVSCFAFSIYLALSMYSNLMKIYGPTRHSCHVE